MWIEKRDLYMFLVSGFRISRLTKASSVAFLEPPGATHLETTDAVIRPKVRFSQFVVAPVPIMGPQPEMPANSNPRFSPKTLPTP